MIELNKNNEIFIFDVKNILKIYISYDSYEEEYDMDIFLHEENYINIRYIDKKDLNADLKLIKEKMKESRS